MDERHRGRMTNVATLKRLTSDLTECAHFFTKLSLSLRDLIKLVIMTLSIASLTSLRKYIIYFKPFSPDDF